LTKLQHGKKTTKQFNEENSNVILMTRRKRKEQKLEAVYMKNKAIL